jgi:hypothetical protein
MSSVQGARLLSSDGRVCRGEHGVGRSGPRLLVRQTHARVALDTVGANTMFSNGRTCGGRRSNRCYCAASVGRQHTLLYSVCRPHFYCVEKVTASFEDEGYKYLLAGPWGGLLTFSNTLVHHLS